MSEVEPSDLVALILKPNRDDFRKQEQIKLYHNISSGKVNKIYAEVEKLIPGEIGESLKRGIQSAILGGIYGFCDRELDPFSAKHYPLFKDIISEILQAYEMVSNERFDEDLWIFETFDYGIKKVYYLDWKLYLSQICY